MGKDMTVGGEVKILIDPIVKGLTTKDGVDVQKMSHDYSLPRVPDKVRDINKDAYTPKFVSIGPYHRGHHPSNPLRREGLKTRYLWSLLALVEKDPTKHYQLFNACWLRLTGLEDRARRFYADGIQLDGPEEFVRMLLLDGCFIIYHLFNNARNFDEPELYQTRWAPAQLRIDLGLLENQIPYFVLEALWECLKPKNLEPTTANMVLRRLATWYFLTNWFSLIKEDEVNVLLVHIDKFGKTIHHLLHLVHLSHSAMIEKEQKQEKQSCGLGDFPFCTLECLCIQFMTLLTEPKKLLSRSTDGHADDMRQNIASAAELSRLAVRFEKSPETRRGWLNVRFRDDNRTLEIPPLPIDRATAQLLNNLIALEQHYTHQLEAKTDPSGSQDKSKPQDYFSTYAFLMYNLVNTQEDIALLQKEGILLNNYGSDEQIIQYFKDICLWSQRSRETHLEEVLTKLRERTEHRQYRDWAELKKYCNSPTTVLLLIVSVIMFASTIVQTIATLRG